MSLRLRGPSQAAQPPRDDDDPARSIPGGTRPNIVFILTDDHAAHAISAYSGRVNSTPNLDRIAAEGARIDPVYCTNSICTPTRATILTGTYSHINRAATIYSEFDYRVRTFPQVLKDCGYQTSRYGKWHLGRTRCATPPRLRRDRRDLPRPGGIHRSRHERHRADGERGDAVVAGYATDIVTDQSLEFLDARRPGPRDAVLPAPAPQGPAPPPTRARTPRAWSGPPPEGGRLRSGREAAEDPRLTVTNPPRNTSITSAPPIFNSGLSGDRLRPFFGAITRSGR